MILDTPGGVVERVVRVLRHHYDEVKFVIYFWFLLDHMVRNGLASFVHTPYFF